MHEIVAAAVLGAVVGLSFAHSRMLWDRIRQARSARMHRPD
jgi:hypothetical protein